MKPAWLNKKISLGDCSQLKLLLKQLRLHTVCEEALCPNMGECFSRRQATFIILGAICTRGCRFCGIAKGSPLPVDLDEPRRVALAAQELKLSHVVVTSVTRDDLTDGGAEVFARTVRLLHGLENCPAVETLIPDFNAEESSLRALADANPEIIAHNMETVPGLYQEIRPNGASYGRSLDVLRLLRKISPGIRLKSGLMLGLGEKKEDVLAVFDDLIAAGCDFLSIGQYLAPSNAHIPVKEYLHPEVFEGYKEEAYQRGFKYVKSGPYVRSSYAASDYKAADSCLNV
ncbi:MAG: lipoyl synthase [Candidatus Omnitrophota bacterium]|jgi:lipoic acid synthetase